MPLTDVQVKNAKPGKRPPIRLKGVRNGSDESSPTEKTVEKNTEAARKFKTKSGDQPKSYKLYDGDNLYIEVFQNGSKIWRFRFKFPKENVISLGKYPKVSLAKAREERDKCLELLSKGIDPSLHRKVMKNVQTGKSENSFETIARAWLREYIDPKPASRKRVYARFENDVFPWIGKRPIREILPQEIRAVVQRIEQRGAGIPHIARWEAAVRYSGGPSRTVFAKVIPVATSAER